MPVYMPWLTVACALLVCVGVISASIVDGYFVPLAMALIIILLIFVLKIRRSLLLFSLLPLLAFAYARYRVEGPTANDLSAYLNRTVVFAASLVDKAEYQNSGRMAANNIAVLDVHKLIFPRNKEISGRVRLVIFTANRTKSPGYQEGQILQIKGQVLALTKYQEPWSAGMIALDRRQGIFCCVEANADDVLVIGRGVIGNSTAKSCSALIDLIRKRITAVHLQSLGTKCGSLLASMVLGNQAVSLDLNLLAAFRKVGLSHLVAASGFNLTVVTMITYWILRIICPDKRIVTLAVGGNVLIYAALAGLSASIVRAAITCMLVLIAKYFHRRLHGLATLALGLIINVIADPSAVIEPGGQLSYAATAGIICGAETVAKSLSFGNANKLINIFSATLSVVLMAQLAVIPVQIYHFWQMGMLFLPANLIIDPLVTPVTIIGFSASLASLLNLPGLPFGLVICQWLDWLAAIPLQIIICVTEKLAACDLAVLNTGQPTVMVIVFYYVMFAIWLICLRNKRRWLLSTVLFLSSLMILFYQPELKRPVVVVLPRAVICISTKRQAFCFGNLDRQVNKILAFYATKNNRWCTFGENNPKPISLQLEDKPQTIVVSLVKESVVCPDKVKWVNEVDNSCLLLRVSDQREQNLYAILPKKNQLYMGNRLLKGQLTRQLGSDLDLKICCSNKCFVFFKLADKNDRLLLGK